MVIPLFQDLNLQGGVSPEHNQDSIFAIKKHRYYFHLLTHFQSLYNCLNIESDSQPN